MLEAKQAREIRRSKTKKIDKERERKEEEQKNLDRKCGRRGEQSGPPDLLFSVLIFGLSTLEPTNAAL